MGDGLNIVFSHDVTLSGWLGSKYQLTNVTKTNSCAHFNVTGKETSLYPCRGLCAELHVLTSTVIVPQAFGLTTMLYYAGSPQWGAVDAEVKVPSGENTELNNFPFKAWSRSLYSHTCYAYCQGFLPYFYPSGPFTCIFQKPFPFFFLCWLWLTPVPV